MVPEKEVIKKEEVLYKTLNKSIVKKLQDNGMEVVSVIGGFIGVTHKCFYLRGNLEVGTKDFTQLEKDSIKQTNEFEVKDAIIVRKIKSEKEKQDSYSHVKKSKNERN